MVALFNVVLSVGLATLLNKTGPTLASDRKGRIFLIGLCGLAALCGLLPHFTGAAILFILMACQGINFLAFWSGIDPRAENRGSHANECRPLFDGNFKVMTHAH